MRAVAKETAAALAALAAYVITVLPKVRRELRRWRMLAEAMPNQRRRQQALTSLGEKRSNVEAVAVFAILAPLRHRRAVLRAIVPLQLAIDYRDTLEEAGDDSGDDDYLTALNASWVREVESLTGCGAVAPTLRAAVERCAEGQLRTHAAPGDVAALERWAQELPLPPGYRWWEVAAGASSSVAAHALIALAAVPRVDAAAAAAVDAAYYPAIGALTVLLDDLVDLEPDLEAGEHNYIAYYRDAAETADRLGAIAREAAGDVGRLAEGRRHVAILNGITAFYLSHRRGSAFLQEVRERLSPPKGSGAWILQVYLRLREGR